MPTSETTAFENHCRVMPTFNLPQTSPPVPVKLTEDLSEEQLLAFPAFKNWLSTLRTSLDL